MCSDRLFAQNLSTHNAAAEDVARQMNLTRPNQTHPNPRVGGEPLIDSDTVGGACFLPRWRYWSVPKWNLSYMSDRCSGQKVAVARRLAVEDENSVTRRHFDEVQKGQPLCD